MLCYILFECQKKNNKQKCDSIPERVDMEGKKFVRWHEFFVAVAVVDVVVVAVANKHRTH